MRDAGINPGSSVELPTDVNSNAGTFLHPPRVATKVPGKHKPRGIDGYCGIIQLLWAI
jgi:hypothetical protein